METVGLSPKAILAACLPAITTLVTVLVNALASGAFDRTEIIGALGGVALSLLAFIGAWAGKPGTVVTEVGPASDELLRYPQGAPPPA